MLEDYTFKLHVRYAPATNPTTTLAPPLNLLEQLSTTTLSPSALPKDSASLELESLDAAQLHDLQVMSNQMDLLADYRRNNWLCVAAMCISLCTSSFFLFILPITEMCKRRELFMGIVDLVSFATIPFLLTTRIFIVEVLDRSLAGGLRGAHKLLNAERVQNILQCSINPRERVSFFLTLFCYCNILIINTILVAFLFGCCFVDCFPDYSAQISHRFGSSHIALHRRGLFD